MELSVNKINDKQNIFGDNIAFIEQWNFSKANLSQENRILAITQVASICYQSPKALGSESLYNRLLAESKGLPSSSFEFVPVLLDPSKDEHKILLGRVNSNVRKYGEFVTDGIPNGELKSYLLTNYRALVYDFEDRALGFEGPDFDDVREDLRKQYLEVFNTEEECAIIAKHFKVFRYNVDLPTRSQMVRHRVNWQELSRRYVSGKRVGFDFYISEKMKKVISKNGYDEDLITYSTQDVIDIALQHYFKALEDGVKPEEARRIIPQAAYTQIWGSFQPSQLENYFKLRLDSHAQWEIQQTAIAMNELISKEFK